MRTLLSLLLCVMLCCPPSAIAQAVSVASHPHTVNTIWSGSGAPNDSLGNPGDFYIDTVADVLYGPKTVSGWPGSGVSLTGNGVPGATGPTGPTGPAGPTGPPGASGSGTGTINSGTVNQFAVYPGTGTTVSGHTLVSGDIPPLSYDASGAATAAQSAAISTAETFSANASNLSSGTVPAARLPAPTVLQAGTHVGYGDSITSGYEACGVVSTTNLACDYLTLLAADERATVTNNGVSGDQVCDTDENKIFTAAASVPVLDNNPIYTMLIGTNDANNKGAGSYETVFQGCHKASIAWEALATKIPANSTNCTDTGTWSAITGWATMILGESSTASGSTKTCAITTFGGPIYAWYYNRDASVNGSFTWAVDGGSTTTINSATSPAIATTNGSTFAWNLLRVPVSAGSHSIVFTITSSSPTNGQVFIGAIATPPAQAAYGMPRIYVSGVPKQDNDANSAATAAYNADSLADVNLLAGDGLGVSFVDVRKYVCTQIAASHCDNAVGVPDMMADALHPNQTGQQGLKRAFEETEQFTPANAALGTYQAALSFTGTGTKTVTATAAGTSGDCAQWTSAGDIVATGSPCGSGGSTAFSALTASTNTTAAMVIGSGASLAVTGSGTIGATSVPVAGVTSLTFTGSTTKAASSTGSITTGDCAKWDASGNVIDAGSACGSGGSSAFSSVTSGTNTGAAMVVGSGATLAATGSGTIVATSVPASGLPNPAASTLGGIESLASTSHQWINTISTSGVPSSTQPAFSDVSGTATDAQLPTDQCTLTKYTVAYTALTAAASATPTSTLVALAGTSTRICLIEISGTTSFTGTSLTAMTVRVQSSASSPMLYSPNQDVFGTVGSTTNNFWSDAGNVADRGSGGQSVVAAFTLTGAVSSALSAGSVNITIGTRLMP